MYNVLQFMRGMKVIKSLDLRKVGKGIRDNLKGEALKAKEETVSFCAKLWCVSTWNIAHGLGPESQGRQSRRNLMEDIRTHMEPFS